MGMAASQARYLALVARKSNCEYEGQQINQSRLALSNQSADLFNQMMTLEVPSPPSKTDYTYKQYSYKIGEKVYTIDKWNQLAEPDSEGYNYVVTYHYNSSEFTGYQKYKMNPQVQFRGSVPPYPAEYSTQITKIKDAQANLAECQKTYNDAVATYKTLLSQASNLTFYRDSLVSGLTKDDVKKYVPGESDTKQGYTIKTSVYDNNRYQVFTYTYTPAGGSETTVDRYYKDGKYYQKNNTGEYVDIPDGEDTTKYVAKKEDRNYISYDTLEDKTAAKEAYDALVKYGALPEGYSLNNVYYDSTSKTIAFLDGIENVSTGVSSILYTYHPTYTPPEGVEVNFHGIKETDTEIETAKTAMQAAKSALDIAQATFDSLDMPEYIGNVELTSLGELTDDQIADIVQIIKDMKEAGIETTLTRCFDTLEGTYNNDTYVGGIYTYEQAGKTYYATFYDLADSAANGTGINHIDNQPKLAYYGAEDMDQPKTVTEKAVVEADSSGRFTSIRFENDSIVYQLNSETATDEVAYDDAMNQYNYARALYDKQVSDINAKTSIIQRQDQNLELRLKQLDTEQNALNTEIDAVSKVVKDNVEKSFKTFGG